MLRQLRVIEEDPEGAHSHRQTRGLRGPGQLPVGLQALLGASRHAGDEKGQGQVVLEEPAGRVYLVGIQLGKAAVQKAQAREAAGTPLNREPGGVDADREMLLLPEANFGAPWRVGTHGIHPPECCPDRRSRPVPAGPG